MAYGPPPQAKDFIASWVEVGKPAVLAAGDKPEGRLERIEAEVVRLSLANLMTFPGSPRRSPPIDLRSRVTGSTSTPACWRASGRAGLSRWIEAAPRATVI